MKNLALALFGLSLSGAALASGHALPYQFKEDTGNLQSVQRGARNFMNYCSGCHSLKHLRYGRLGQDLRIPDDLLKANLMFTAEKTGEHIMSSMPAADGAKWFGQAPPDLTLEARARGADWVYNYLMTFYIDGKRPAGVNNLVLPGVSMPHVLGDLQGWQVLKEEHKSEGGTEEGAAEGGHGEEHHGPQLELAIPGKLSPEEYAKFSADTTNFLAYAAEPGKKQRVSTGVGVILFLIIFTVLSYMLKKEYWRDVH